MERCSLQWLNGQPQCASLRETSEHFAAWGGWGLSWETSCWLLKIKLDPWPCCSVPCSVTKRLGSKHPVTLPYCSVPGTLMAWRADIVVRVHSHCIICQSRDSRGRWIVDPQTCLRVAWYFSLLSPASPHPLPQVQRVAVGSPRLVCF